MKCGATKKSDGEPCQNLPLANGRCRLHGGATPSGKDWHVPRYPESDTTARAAKSDRKAADVAKRARKLAKRLAAMTPEERAHYDEWKRTHKPGTPAARSAARRMAAHNKATRELLARPDAPPPPDPRLAKVDEILARYERKQPSPSNDEGVFG